MAPSFQRETQPAAMRYARSCGLWSIPSIQAWSTNVSLFSDYTIFCWKILTCTYSAHSVGQLVPSLSQPNGSPKDAASPEKLLLGEGMSQQVPPAGPSLCRELHLWQWCSDSFHQQHSTGSKASWTPTRSSDRKFKIHPARHGAETA